MGIEVDAAGGSAHVGSAYEKASHGSGTAESNCHCPGGRRHIFGHSFVSSLGIICTKALTVCVGDEKSIVTDTYCWRHEVRLNGARCGGKPGRFYQMTGRHDACNICMTCERNPDFHPPVVDFPCHFSVGTGVDGDIGWWHPMLALTVVDARCEPAPQARRMNLSSLRIPTCWPAGSIYPYRCGQSYPGLTVAHDVAPRERSKGLRWEERVTDEKGAVVAKYTPASWRKTCASCSSIPA